jgi:ketosteroid isomerase-like protein
MMPRLSRKDAKMADRETMLRNIEEAYAARTRGDREELAKYWAPGGTYRLVGAETLAGIAAGATEANEAIGALISLFQFHEVERLATLVDGNRVALHWRVTFTSGESDPATVELCDLWEVADDGKLLSLTQFTDTQLIARYL